MAASPNNPGIVILLVLAALILVPSTLAAVDESVSGEGGALLGLALGLAISGVAFAALGAPRETRHLAWLSYGLALWGSGMLIAYALDDFFAFVLLFWGHVAGWLVVPFALAVQNQSGPPSPE